MPIVAESQSTKQQEASTSKSATVAESPRPDGSNFGKSFGCSGGADQPPTATQARVPPRWYWPCFCSFVYSCFGVFFFYLGHRYLLASFIIRCKLSKQYFSHPITCVFFMHCWSITFQKYIVDTFYHLTTFNGESCQDPRYWSCLKYAQQAGGDIAFNCKCRCKSANTNCPLATSTLSIFRIHWN